MILLVDMNEHNLSFTEFVAPIERVIKENGFSCIISSYKSVDAVSLSKADKIILSGTPLKDMEFSKSDLSEIIKCGKPVLGICAGMQALALAFGARLERLQEIGMIKVSIVKPTLLAESDFEAYSLHNYGPTLPDNFEVLAQSIVCHQIIKHKDKPIFGTLFHPEVRTQGLIKNFISFS